MAKIDFTRGIPTKVKSLIRFSEFGNGIYTVHGHGEDDRLAGSGYMVDGAFSLTTFTGLVSGSYAEIFLDLALALQAAANALVEFEVSNGGTYWHVDYAQRSFLVSGDYGGVVDNHTYTDTNGEYAGFWIVYDATYTNRLLAVTMDAGGGSTITDCGAVAAVDRFALAIRKNPDGSYEFYKDDVLVATHTTNLPASYPIYCKIGISSQSDNDDEQIAWNYISVYDFKKLEA